jgi:hypothetical protein
VYAHASKSPSSSRKPTALAIAVTHSIDCLLFTVVWIVVLICQCSGLYQADRVLLREGELQEVKRGSAVLDMGRIQNVYYCLFNDMLLRAEKRRMGLTAQWQVMTQIPADSIEFLAYDDACMLRSTIATSPHNFTSTPTCTRCLPLR